MWTKAFLLAIIERAVKTFAQSAAALLVAAGTGLLAVDWLQILSVAGLAAVVSVLTSVGTGVVTDGSPSVGNVETVAGPSYTGPSYTPERVDYDQPDGAEVDGPEDLTELEAESDELRDVSGI